MSEEAVLKEVVEEIVSKEVAREEFKRFAKEFDIDTDFENMSEEDSKTFEDQSKKILKAIMGGHAVIDEEGNIIYTLKRPRKSSSFKEIKFTVPMGNVFTEMDNHKEHKQMHKLNNAMSVMTGNPPVMFANMNSIDVKFCQAVAVLFLGS